jgi:hypothetical protein
MVLRCHRSVDGTHFESIGDKPVYFDGYLRMVSERVGQNDKPAVLSDKGVQIGIGPLGTLKRGIVKAQDEYVLTIRVDFNPAKNSEGDVSVVQFFQSLKWHKTVMVGKDNGIQARRHRGADLLLFRCSTADGAFFAVNVEVYFHVNLNLGQRLFQIGDDVAGVFDAG